MLTSSGVPFEAVASTSRGFLSDHNANPASADAEVRRKPRRLKLTDCSFLSISDSNISEPSSSVTCRYRAQETAGEDELPSAHRCKRCTDCWDGSRRSPGDKLRPDRRLSMEPTASRSDAGTL